MFNELAFKGKAVERGYTLGNLAKEIGINPATLTRKMTGESDFTRAEIIKIRDILNLSAQEVENIFFPEKLT